MLQIQPCTNCGLKPQWNDPGKGKEERKEEGNGDEGKFPQPRAARETVLLPLLPDFGDRRAS